MNSLCLPGGAILIEDYRQGLIDALSGCGAQHVGLASGYPLEEVAVGSSAEGWAIAGEQQPA